MQGVRPPVSSFFHIHLVAVRLRIHRHSAEVVERLVADHIRLDCRAAGVDLHIQPDLGAAGVDLHIHLDFLAAGVGLRSRLGLAGWERIRLEIQWESVGQPHHQLGMVKRDSPQQWNQLRL